MKKKLKKFHPAFAKLKHLARCDYKRAITNRLNLAETPDGFASHYEPFVALEETIISEYRTLSEEANPSSPKFNQISYCVWHASLRCLELDRQFTKGGVPGDQECLCPTLAIQKDLADLFIKTEYPDDLGLNDIAWDHGIVFFDKGMNNGSFSQYPCWLAFAKTEFSNSEVPGLFMGIPMRNGDSAWRLTHLPLGQKDFGVNTEGMQHITLDETGYISTLTRVFANFLAYTSSIPEEDLPSSAPPRPKGFGDNPIKSRKERSVRLFRETTHNKQSPVPRTTPATHASPRTHWRRGHWRRVACGKQFSERQLRWIKPVLVNS